MLHFKMVRPKLIVVDIAPALIGLEQFDSHLMRNLVLNVFDELISDCRHGAKGPANIPRVNARLLKKPSVADLEALQMAFSSIYLGIVVILTQHGLHLLVDENGSFDYAVSRFDLSGRLLLERFGGDET